jgi:DNA-binding XRE family transcriptional regulator
MPEFWLAIPGCSGLYEASSHGHIRSYRQDPAGKILKATSTSKGDGRRRVTVLLDGKMTPCTVAFLVARAFIGIRPPGQYVCHGPAGRTDDNPGNLYYGTPKRNQEDRVRDGTEPAGEQNGRATLTWMLVREIRQRYQDGSRQSDLATEFGVARSVIGGIIRGELWIDPGYRNLRRKPVRGSDARRGEYNGNVKLTWAAVTEIRTRYAAGEIQADLAQAFGVHKATIARITQNKTWTRLLDQDPGGSSSSL